LSISKKLAWRWTIKVSILATAFRPGGWDIFLAGMRDQTFRDFEVIAIDHRYSIRKDKVLEMAKRYLPDIQFTYAPEHRRNGIWYVGASSFNTAFALAEGEVVIMLLDYSYCPPQWAQRHWDMHQDGTKKLIVAPHAYIYLPRDKLAIAPEHIDEAWFRPEKRPDLSPEVRFEAENRGRYCWEEDKFLRGGIIDEMSLFTETFMPSWLSWLKIREAPYNDPKLIMPSGPIGGEFFHAKNESFKLETILDMNGVPEMVDHGKGPWDTLLGHMFTKAGCQIWLDNLNPVYCVNPRPIMPSMPWGGFSAFGGSPPGRWTWEQGVAYQDERLAHMAKTGDYRSPNPFSLRELRKEYLEHKRKGVFPIVDIPDNLYYKEEVIA